MGEVTAVPFWQAKRLDQMSRAEWESLCDGCGKCCVHKLEDEDTGELVATNVACRLLDRRSGRCTDYKHRHAYVPECVRLTPAKAGALDWLPSTCAYRLLANGEPLADWHPLISGDPESVHRAGQSVRGWTVSEDDVGDFEEIMSSIGRSDLSFTAGELVRPLIVRRMARARRMRLVVDPRDGAVRLTLPARAALAPALAWVETKRGWIERRLGGLAAPVPLADGAAVPIRGTAVTIRWDPAAPRRPLLAGDQLLVGGAVESLGPRLLRFLRGEARRQLAAESAALAAAHGITLGRIAIGDARSRWGSCTAAGDIRYSWRLILAPDFVRRATVAHEVAHRLHMDHSAAFHAAAARLLGADPAPARAWLRANGAALHAYTA